LSPDLLPIVDALLGGVAESLWDESLISRLVLVEPGHRDVVTMAVLVQISVGYDDRGKHRISLQHAIGPGQRGIAWPEFKAQNQPFSRPDVDQGVVVLY